MSCSAGTCGAGDRRDHSPHPAEQVTAGDVEVVAVVVVAEQHRVDRREVGHGDRRSGDLARRRSPAEAVFPPRGVERRIGQDRPAFGLDEGRRSTDVGQPDVAHLAWLTAQSNA